MKIMQLSEKEIRANQTELRDLWRDCFGDTESYMDFYFDQKAVDSIVFALYEEGLCSMLWLNPYEISMNGEQFKEYYIVGVATKEECRGRGYMKALILESFAFMYEKKNPFTYLMPAAEAIYSPYDFRFVYEKEMLEVNIQNAVMAQDKTNIYTWDELDKEQRAQAVFMENTLLKDEFDVYVIRSEAYYDRLSKEMKACDGAVLVLMKEDKVSGMISYMHESEIVEVSEVIVTSGQTLDCFADYIVNKYDGQVATIKFLESHFLNEKGTIQKKPTIMARIVNIKQYLMCLPVEPGSRLVIEVRDHWIKENNGKFVIYEKDGRTVAEETNEEASICMDIAEWTDYFFGTNDIQIQEVGNKTLETMNKLSRIYINEIV